MCDFTCDFPSEIRIFTLATPSIEMPTDLCGRHYRGLTPPVREHVIRTQLLG